tara:strand:+ start:148 stop:669 length:522 start_codon:yes stop_codon:yes gene_type:complete
VKNFLKVITLFFLFLHTSVSADNSIAFVDVDNLISTSKPGLNVLKQLGNLRDDNIKDFKKKEKIIKENEENILKQKNILSPDEFQTKINQLKKEISKYNKYRDTKIKSFKQIKINNTNKLLNLINPIITEYASDKSISMIILKKNIILGKAELDITKDIIVLIDKKIKKFKIE